MTAHLARVARLSGVPLVVVILITGVLSVSTASGESDQGGQWPLSPRPAVVHGFDPTDLPWQRGHRGVDLAASMLQPVLAPRAGRVSFVGVIAGVPSVSIDHGTERSTFQPVVALVTVGADVAAGTWIGRVSLVGSHCWPSACLHWGVIRNGTDPAQYVDPLAWLGRRRVRLLPLLPASPFTPPRLLLRPRVGLFEGFA